MDAHIAVLLIVALVVVAVWLGPGARGPAAAAAALAAAALVVGEGVREKLAAGGTASGDTAGGGPVPPLAPADVFALVRGAIEEGGARVVLVSGPAGSGKSHLARRLETELSGVVAVEVDDVVPPTKDGKKFHAVYGGDVPAVDAAVRQSVAEKTAELVEAGLSNARAVVVAAAARGDFWARLTALLPAKGARVQHFVIRPSVSNLANQLVLRALRAARRGRVRRIPGTREFMLPRGTDSPAGLWERFERGGLRLAARSLEHLTVPYAREQIQVWGETGAYGAGPGRTVVRVGLSDHIGRAAKRLWEGVCPAEPEAGV